MNNESKSVSEKICVTCEGNTLDSKVDPRFGRCMYFIFIKPASMEFEALENPNLNSSGGAGIQSGQLMAQKNVKAVLTGNVGPNAFATLQAAGIEVFINVTGTVKEAVENYKQGKYEATKSPSVGSKFGMPNK